MDSLVKSDVWTETDTKVLHLLASLLTQQNREEKACELLEFALSRSPDNLEVMKALSAVCLLTRKNDRALELADTALSQIQERSDDRAPLLLVRSKALWGLGRETESRVAMDEYIWNRTVR